MRLFILAVFALLLVGCSAEEGLSVVAFKAGKADSFLIQSQGKHILIDTGEDDDGQKIAKYLRHNNVKKLDALIITHFDKDHIGGADHIIKELQIDKIYTPNYYSDRKQTTEFWDAVATKNLNVTTLTKDEHFSIEDMDFTIMPPKHTYELDNDRSLVTSITFKETSFLFTGDIMEQRIADMLKDNELTAHTFLKVPHHGRYNAQTDALIAAVQPIVALIPSSTKNPEDAAVVDALQAIEATVLTTKDENIILHTDGSTIDGFIESNKPYSLSY